MSSVICCVPLCGTVVSGGGPVLTSSLSTGFCASPLSAGFVVQVHFAAAWLAAAAGVLAGVPPVVDTTIADDDADHGEHADAAEDAVAAAPAVRRVLLAGRHLALESGSRRRALAVLEVRHGGSPWYG